LWLVVKRKITNYVCHPALVAGSGVAILVLICITRPRNKCGVTGLSKAFTLVELAIVLVIIGLLAGGVLVGKDLIKAAEIRSQVSQIEKLQISVNTFKVKYGGLPGDLLATEASQFGIFSSQDGAVRARGDGNGILESGGYGCMISAGLTNCLYGEFLILFRQLSDTNLIDGKYANDTDLCDYTPRPKYSTTLQEIEKYIPRSKIGKSSFITSSSYNGINYFSLSGFVSLGLGNCNGYYGSIGSYAAQNPLSAYEAYSIDIKTDDGKPNSGTTKAVDFYRDISNNLSLWVQTSTIANCVTGGTDYNLSNENTAACSLSFKFK